MNEPFVEMLRGEQNNLGRTIEVFDIVQAHPDRLAEVFELYFQPDEWVRMRASNVLKRSWREDPRGIKPFVKRWVSEVAAIDQPSVNWTFGQLVLECKDQLSSAEKSAAIEHLKRYLTDSDDWIVLNSTIATLADYAETDTALQKWLVPKLQKMTSHPKKSVARRSQKAVEKLI